MYFKYLITLIKSPIYIYKRYKWKQQNAAALEKMKQSWKQEDLKLVQEILQRNKQ